MKMRIFGAVYLNRLSVRIYGFLMLAVVLLAVGLYFLVIRDLREQIYQRELNHSEQKLHQLYRDIKSNVGWFQVVEERERQRNIEQLRLMIDSAFTIAEEVKADIGERNRNEQEAKADVLDLIGHLHFQSENYVWVIDTNGITLSHPNASLVGRDVTGLKDSTGKLIIQPFLDQLRDEGQKEAYNEYLFPHAGSVVEVQKISYARLFKEWDWIIGSGVYLDYVQKAVDSAKADLISRLSDELKTYKFGATGYATIIDGDAMAVVHPIRELEGKSTLHLKNPDTGQPLFHDMKRAFDRGELLYHYTWNHPADPDNYIYQKVSLLKHVPELDWYLLATMYTDELEEQAGLVARRVILQIVLVLLILAVVVALFVHRELKPIQQLTRAAARVGNGYYDEKIEFKADDEIGVLAKTFDSMLQHIRRDIDSFRTYQAYLNKARDEAEASSHSKDAALKEARAAQERLDYLANHDPLTGLPNRNLFEKRLRSAMDKAVENEHIVAVLFLDLDHFKAVNDSLGHSAGDELLCAVAKRFMRQIRRQDVLARQGGDEFTILIDDIYDREDAHRIATHLLECLENPINLSGGHKVQIKTCIGISTFPRDGANINELIEKADKAMYSAKEEGRNCIRFYTEPQTE